MQQTFIQCPLVAADRMPTYVKYNPQIWNVEQTYDIWNGRMETVMEIATRMLMYDVWNPHAWRGMRERRKVLTASASCMLTYGI